MNVYLWKRNGAAFFHTDLDAAAQIDGFTSAPDLTVGVVEFEASGSTARIVDGKIVLGLGEDNPMAEGEKLPA